MPDVTLDIYGQGGEMGRLSQLINQYKANSYIRLMGQHDLTTVYQKYAAYIAGSTSEGFGLSLLEAVGSGLPMIGFDVPYGNQTFIDDCRMLRIGVTIKRLTFWPERSSNSLPKPIKKSSSSVHMNWLSHI